MKQLFCVFMLSFLFMSCSSDNDTDDQLSKQFKAIKVVITHDSPKLYDFITQMMVSLPKNSENNQFNSKNFDLVNTQDPNYLLLAKNQNQLAKSYEFEIKQKDVSIQIVNTPYISDLVEDKDNFETPLTTTIEIFVNGKSVKKESFIYELNSPIANAQIISYEEN